MKPEVSITIVCYNDKGLLKNALESIRDARISLPYEVIVLDNKSANQEDIMHMLSEEYPEVNVIREDTNTGFTRGVNTCARHSRGEFVFNMNPDVVVRSGQLEALVEFLKENSDVGLVGPKLLNFDHTLQGSAFRFTTPQVALYRRTPLGRVPFARKRIQAFLLDDGWKWDTERDVDWILGAAVMYRRSVAEYLGYLDEDMFLYFSDIDFAWRLWEAGYRVVYYPGAVLYHYYHRASGGMISPGKLFSFVFRKHVVDATIFFKKHLRKSNPRLKFKNQTL